MKKVRFLGLLTRPTRTYYTRVPRQCFATKATLQYPVPPPEAMSTVPGDNGPTAPAPPVDNDAAVEPSSKEEKPLPKLTPSEFRQYNRMAVEMNRYHEHFRAMWKVVYSACEVGKRPENMSIRQFISTCKQFCRKTTFSHHLPFCSTPISRSRYQPHPNTPQSNRFFLKKNY